MAENNIGKVVQVIGPVLDVAFDPENLPDIYNALSVESSGGNGSDVQLVVEVQQHIGRGMV
ncbi:MAG TPA: F0F1 ATP synthase subunit beta, partial [Gemmatimonadetes bacterium]|nr:F0F1 ATP synthase subunit beta [Gemmatimonadota bacterium]